MKVVTDRAGYWRAIEEMGGIDMLTVLSTYTFCDGSPYFGPGRHIYTEWGTRYGHHFVCEHEEHNGEHTYRVSSRLVPPDLKGTDTKEGTGA